MTRRALLVKLAQSCGVINLQERDDWERHKHTWTPYARAYQECAYRFQNMYCLLQQPKAEIAGNTLDVRSTAVADLEAEAQQFVKDVARMRKARFS